MENIKNNIKKKVRIAKEISDETKLENDYKLIVFESSLNYLLENVQTSKKVIENDVEPVPVKNFTMPSGKTFAGFLKSIDAKSHANKVLSVAYHLLKAKNMVMFTKEDIEKEYKAAFLPKSKNTNAEINNLIQRGLLMPAEQKVDGKKSYSMTMDGISYVEQELIKNGK